MVEKVVGSSHRLSQKQYDRVKEKELCFFCLFFFNASFMHRLWLFLMFSLTPVTTGKRTKKTMKEGKEKRRNGRSPTGIKS